MRPVGKRVVEVLGVVGIDGEGDDPSEILAPRNLSRRDERGDIGGFLLDRLRKRRRQIVLPHDGKQIDPRRIRRAEHFDDLPGRNRAPVGPVAQFDDHLLAQRRRLGRRGHADVVGNAGFIGPHIIELRRLAENAHQVTALALQQPDDFPAQPALASALLETRHDQVAVQRMGCVIAGDIEVGFGRIARNEEAEAALVHLEMADRITELLRRNETPARIAHGAAGQFLLGQKLKEGLRLGLGNVQLPDQISFGQRLVIRV